MSESSKFVLIVEDNIIANKAMTAICKMQGWQVRSAHTVEAAMSALTPAPTCIILDLMLPDGNGEQVLREVRRRKDRSRVIIATGDSCSQRLEDVNNLQPDCFMQKPVDGEALLNQIHAYMDE